MLPPARPPAVEPPDRFRALMRSARTPRSADCLSLICRRNAAGPSDLLLICRRNLRSSKINKITSNVANFWQARSRLAPQPQRRQILIYKINNIQKSY